MKLFRSREMPGHWIGEDENGNLMLWAATPGGWQKRTAWTGGKRHLDGVEPALARGTGWPGGGTGRKPRIGSEPSNRRITLRATDAEADAWEARAAALGQGVTVWARDELNAAAARTLSPAAPKPQSQLGAALSAGLKRSKP